MMPFGKEVVQQEGGSSFLSQIFNIVWLVFFGWEIALLHLFHGLLLTITVVGIPFGRKHFQLIPVSLLPFTYTLRDDR